jgi:hypothetical protein
MTHLEVILEKKQEEVYQIYYNRGKIKESEKYEVRPVREYLSKREKSIKNHYLIELYSPLGDGMGEWDSHTKLIGLAHGIEELPKRLYECAVKEAKKLAKKSKAKFVNLVENNKEQESEQKVIYNSFGAPLTGPGAEKLRRLSGKY